MVIEEQSEPRKKYAEGKERNGRKNKWQKELRGVEQREIRIKNKRIKKNKNKIYIKMKTEEAIASNTENKADCPVN